MYVLCVGATIFYPPLPDKNDQGFEHAMTQRDESIVFHCLVVIGVAIVAVFKFENPHLSLEIMGGVPIIIHGIFFNIPNRLTKHFWKWFIVTFELIFIGFAIFIATLH